eukprot:6208278-Pleurochrysis_carterae.AAC.6
MQEHWSRRPFAAIFRRERRRQRGPDRREPARSAAQGVPLRADTGARRVALRRLRAAGRGWRLLLLHLVADCAHRPSGRRAGRRRLAGAHVHLATHCARRQSSLARMATTALGAHPRARRKHGSATGLYSETGQFKSVESALRTSVKEGWRMLCERNDEQNISQPYDGRLTWLQYFLKLRGFPHAVLSMPAMQYGGVSRNSM